MSIYNTTFINNQAYSSSNVMEVMSQILNITFCNFTNNTPIMNFNTQSHGGAMFGQIGSLIIKDSYFWKNVNQLGGCIYVDQHEKYSPFFGWIENCIAWQNTANEDSGFLYVSYGIISLNIFIKSSLFKETFGQCNHLFF